MTLDFADLYGFASKWAGDTTTYGIARAKEAVDEANRILSYGDEVPFRPWWRKREDTITPVAETQGYVFPTNQGTFESMHSVWYRSSGQRIDIEVVEDKRWQEEVNDDTTQAGTPDICNIHKSSGSDRIRFSPTPSSSFISAIVGGVIRLDFFIAETLTFESGDTVEPLMPDSRRYGIAWMATKLLAAAQGDMDIVKVAELNAKRYMLMLRADDLYRTGTRTRRSRPMDPMGKNSRSGTRDYGHYR